MQPPLAPHLCAVRASSQASRAGAASASRRGWMRRRWVRRSEKEWGRAGACVGAAAGGCGQGDAPLTSAANQQIFRQLSQHVLELISEFSEQ